MTGVVLRCPNCGTTKATPGECQACHEAEVRFFCTNHTPGQWLETAACPTCKARFGDPVPRPAPPPPPRAPIPSPPVLPARKRSVPWLPERAGGPWARRTRRTAREDVGEAPHGSGPDPHIGSWPDLIREAALRARRRRSETVRLPDAVPVMAAFGCLMRAVFLIVMMLIAFALFSVLAGGFLLQAF